MRCPWRRHLSLVCCSTLPAGQSWGPAGVLAPPACQTACNREAAWHVVGMWRIQQCCRAGKQHANACIHRRDTGAPPEPGLCKHGWHAAACSAHLLHCCRHQPKVTHSLCSQAHVGIVGASKQARQASQASKQASKQASGGTAFHRRQRWRRRWRGPAAELSHTTCPCVGSPHCCLRHSRASP